MTSLSSDEIRKLVREALTEVLPADKTNGVAHSVSGQPIGTRIASDDELNSFAREIAGADEGKRAAIASGQLRYTLGRNGGAPAQPRSGTHRLDKGVLTEAMVVDIGRANSRIVVGKAVAVTPLARDAAARCIAQGRDRL